MKSLFNSPWKTSTLASINYCYETTNLYLSFKINLPKHHTIHIKTLHYFTIIKCT